MDLALSVIAGILLAAGLLGTFVPVLPGAPLAWIGLLVAFFSANNKITLVCLVVTGIVAVVVSVLDNFMPVLMTNRWGGSKAAVRGSTIGLLIGFFTGPWGIILGPFTGALVGEMLHTKGGLGESLKSAFGAFIGFLFGTGMKMIAVLVFIWIYILSFWV